MIQEDAAERLLWVLEQSLVERHAQMPGKGDLDEFWTDREVLMAQHALEAAYAEGSSRSDPA